MIIDLIVLFERKKIDKIKILLVDFVFVNVIDRIINN